MSYLDNPIHNLAVGLTAYEYDRVMAGRPTPCTGLSGGQNSFNRLCGTEQMCPRLSRKVIPRS